MKNSKDNTKKDVDKGLQVLIDNYKANAEGNNKEKLLSDFLDIFVPTLYDEAGLTQGMDKKLSKLQK